MSLNPSPIPGEFNQSPYVDVDAVTPTISKPRLVARIRSKMNFNRICSASSYLRLFRVFWRRKGLDNSHETPKKDLASIGVLVLAIVFAIVAGAPIPIIGVIFSKLIDGFPPSEHVLELRLKQLLVVAVVYFLVTWAWSFCWSVIGERLAKRYREDLIEKLMTMDIGYFETSSPNISTLLTADIQEIQLGTSEKAGLFIQSMSYFVSAFVTGFLLNSKLTGILLCAVLPGLGITFLFGARAVSKFSALCSKGSSKASKIFEEAVREVRIVKAYGCAAALAEKHFIFTNDALKYGIKRGIASSVTLGFVYFVAYSTNALGFWQGSQIVSFQNWSGAGEVYAVIFLILDASFVLGQFGPFLQNFARAASAGNRIHAILQEPIPSASSFNNTGARLEPGNDGIDISFEDVTFAYPSRPGITTLNCTNFSIQAGEFVAVIGSSGSGKSTIAALMLRYYDPVVGKIIINGADLKDLDLNSVRCRIGVVTQQPTLFPGTILENIACGMCDLPEDPKEVMGTCINAARESQALKFIENLPDGFETIIGPGGDTQLSGGQAARIALARALARNPEILILDEFTAALDYSTESSVMESLLQGRIQSKRIILMISHRLSTVREADKIIVMQDGNIVESGPPCTLLENRGMYWNLMQCNRDDDDHDGASESPSNIPTSAPSSSSSEINVSLKKGPCSADVPKIVPKREPYKAVRIIRRCFQLSRPEIIYTLLGAFCSLFTGSLLVGEAYIFGNIVSTLNERQDLGEEEFASRSKFYCLMFFTIAVVALIAYSGAGSCFAVVSENLTQRIRDISFRATIALDISWFEKPGRSSTTLESKLQTNVSHLSGLSGVIIGTVLSITVSLVGGLSLALFTAWRIAVVLLAAVPIMIGAGFLRFKVLAEAHKRHQNAYVQASAFAVESCREMRTIVALSREPAVVNEFKALLAKPCKESVKFSFQATLWFALALSITYFVYALAYWWGAHEVRRGNATTLGFFIVLPALLFSAQASGQMFSLAPEVTNAQSAAGNLFELLDEKSLVEQQDDTSGPDPEVEPANVKGAVELKNVYFAYPSRPSHLILEDVSINANPGEFIAIVGESGSGKSTLISLLERFYDVKSGSISVNGLDIRDVPTSLHRQHISLVSQNPGLFCGSIMFNIALGANFTATKDDIIEVCKRVGIHEFIMSLPEGYETECGANGCTLSGGQAQRIAICRALIRNPDLLLLDEVTSALDSHAEGVVTEALLRSEGSSNATKVVVAHKLSTIRAADRIYVMADGKVCEVGTYDQLLKLGGIFTAMVKKRANA